MTNETRKNSRNNDPADLSLSAFQDGAGELKSSEEISGGGLKPVLSDEPELAGDSTVTPVLSSLRRSLLLLFFCLAQFLDIFNSSALFSAIPTIAADLNMTGSISVWAFSALQLTFAAFLLISGRISDVYSAKWAFTIGLFGFGLLALGLGLVKEKIGFFVLRALDGVFSALTIPSALNLIVELFPDPAEQSKAIAAFGATGAIANVLGVVIGAALVEKATWEWIFYIVTITSLIIAIASVFLIPNKKTKAILHVDGVKVRDRRFRQLDLVGVAILTSALLLLVFSLTQGANTKWATGGVLAPLIISVLLIAGFLFYEHSLPADMASVPSSTWFLPNFTVLFGTAMLPFFWWTTVFLVFLQYWQEVFLWSPLKSAVHILPAGIACLIMAGTGPLQNKINPKWLILFGEMLVFIGTIIFPFCGRQDHYWNRVFPAFLTGSSGMMLVYVHCNIAIFRATPPDMAGVVGALFNSALQLGSAIGIASVTSISTSIEKKDGPDGIANFSGRADAFWFVFAILCAAIVGLVVFYKPEKSPATDGEVEKRDEERRVPMGSARA